MLRPFSAYLLILLTPGGSSSALSSSRLDGSPQICYYPNGSSTNGTTCGPSQTASACCRSGFIGLGNGLCAPEQDIQTQYNYTIYRSSCTDSTWNSTNCPQVCRGSEDNLDRDQGIVKCDNNTFCCARSTHDCCSNSTESFPLPSPTTGAVTGQFLATAPIATSTSATPPSYPDIPNPSSTSTSPPHTNTKSLVLGAVLGSVIGAFVLLSFLAAFLLLRRSKSRKPPPKRSPKRSPPRPLPKKSILKPPRLPLELPDHSLLPGAYDWRNGLSPAQSPRNWPLVVDPRRSPGTDGSPQSARTPPAGWPGHEMTPVEIDNRRSTRDCRTATSMLRTMVDQANMRQ